VPSAKWCIAPAGRSAPAGTGRPCSRPILAEGRDRIRGTLRFGDLLDELGDQHRLAIVRGQRFVLDGPLGREAELRKMVQHREISLAAAYGRSAGNNRATSDAPLSLRSMRNTPTSSCDTFVIEIPYVCSR